MGGFGIGSTSEVVVVAVLGLSLDCAELMERFRKAEFAGKNSVESLAASGFVVRGVEGMPLEGLEGGKKP